MNKPISIIFSKFLLIGGICYILNLCLLYLFTSVVGMHYLVSAFLAFFLVNTLGYTTNKNFTFEKQELGVWTSIWKYNTVMISSCCIVLLLMFILVNVFHIWYLYANILIAIGSTIYNFILHHKWTFKDSKG